MNEFKVLNTTDLKTLGLKSRNFNRVLDVPTDVDPDGIHVLHRVLYGHNMDSDVVLHHRVRGLVKIKGSKEPWPCIFDIAADDWSSLHDVPETAVPA